MNKIGIDLGGTKIEGILIDISGRVIERKRILTKRDDGYESIVERIVSLIKELQNISKIDVIPVGAAFQPRLNNNSDRVACFRGWKAPPTRSWC